MFSWLQVFTVDMQSGLLEWEHQQLLLNRLERAEQHLSAGGTDPAHMGQGGLTYLSGQSQENIALVQPVLTLYTGICKVSSALF